METANTNTGIFWYVDDCPIPEGLSVLKVSQNMKLALSKLNYSGKVFIHAYGDSQKILEDINNPSGDSLFFLCFIILGMCKALSSSFYH